MPKFKVFIEKKETFYAIIEADSADSAEEKADNYYDNFDWSEVNGSQNSEILFGETDEETDE